ncbi:MAG: hypothetical protein CEE42_12185 [Promethearchaeota archaeon Loki_b31]|nr:MAG: hypothetical protein CEE42_12185 [Candidatus Lokiarchaeota archaeon Loki_b31]
MSEFREDLLVTAISIIQVIKIILVASLLITAFAFSIFFFSLLWGGPRPNPSDRLSEAEDEDAILIYFPTIFEIGDLPDIDPSEYEKEIFRIFDYGAINEIKTKLWKFESFDEYTGDEWKSSLLAGKSLYSFYPMQEYIDNYFPDPELLKIQFPISPAVGNNLMILPSLFPIPFIIEDSIDAPNLDQASTVLYKDDFNAVSVDLHFSDSQPVNLSYQLFGLDLPTDAEINNSALSALYTPLEIRNQYLQLPPSIDSYKLINTFFTNHFNILYGIINISDNAFEVANIIRNYLTSPPFSFPASIPDYNPAPQGRDIVDWFCEQEKGIWSDFASAFCAFTRAFGVASRYVKGFSGFLADEINDTVEGKNALLIKNKNIYNWAEIYVPTDVSGDGEWVQIDIFKGVPYNIFESDYNITVSTDQFAYNRPDVATITATLISNNSSVDNKTIYFTDYLSGQPISSAITDSNGNASILVSINDTQVVGPHIIEAKYDISTFNYTIFNVLGPIEVDLISVNPSEISISDPPPHTSDVQGYVYDPVNGKRIENAEVNFVLLQKGTSSIVPNAFNPETKNTNVNGDFDEILSLNPSVSSGLYEIRVDFNGTWWILTPYFNFPVFIPTITDSSNRLEFNVTEDLPLLFNFWIDGTTFDDYYQPVINRNENVNLSVYLEWGDPLDNEAIDFYDLSQDIFLGTVQTNNGRASLIYNTDASTVAGPHLIYAKWGSNYNYSYFTLNDNITLDVQVGPNPNQINRGGETFTLQGTISDASNGAPIKFTEIYIALFDDTMTDVSYYLSSNWFQLDDTGTFDLTLSVDSGTPAINFTINVGFYGVFIYSFPNNQFNEFNFYFDIFTYSNFTSNDNGNFELKVIDPNNVAIQFWVDGNPALSFYDDSNLPERYNQGDNITFSVYVTVSGSFVSDETVTLTDVYINSQIGSHLFELADNGRWDFVINSSSWHAGLHKIRVQWSTFPAYNTTFVIINKTISISAFSNIPKIQRNVDTFNVYGSVQDGTTNLNGLDIKILLFDSSMNDVSYHLNLAGSQIINVFDGSYQFDVNSISINCPQGQYYFRIDFNGTISQPGIYVTNYMINTSSILVPANITAGTYIVGNYDTIFKGGFYQGDELYAYGYLYWDNGSLITGSRNITITIEDGFGGIIKTEIGSTDGSGWFNITVFIDTIWPDGTEIWANFYPEDSFTPPAHYYIEFTEIELFRP